MPMDKNTLVHSDELKHYGVLGMKWGIRKDDYNKSNFKKHHEIGMDAIKDGVDNFKKYHKIGMDIIKEGVKDSADNFKKYHKIGMDAIKDFIDSDDTLPLAMKSYNTSCEQDASSVNPLYSSGDISYAFNCGNCAIAYDLRRRGYDVEALPSPPPGVYLYTLLNMYEDYDNPIEQLEIYIKMAMQLEQDEEQYDMPTDDQETANEYEKAFIKKYGNNTRGILQIEWANGGGHYVNWEIYNNKLIIFDAQTATIGDISDYLKVSKRMRHFRTDNLDPSEECLKSVKNRG